MQIYLRCEEELLLCLWKVSWRGQEETCQGDGGGRGEVGNEGGGREENLPARHNFSKLDARRWGGRERWDLWGADRFLCTHTRCLLITAFAETFIRCTYTCTILKIWKSRLDNIICKLFILCLMFIKREFRYKTENEIRKSFVINFDSLNSRGTLWYAQLWRTTSSMCRNMFYDWFDLEYKSILPWKNADNVISWSFAHYFNFLTHR